MATENRARKQAPAPDGANVEPTGRLEALQQELAEVRTRLDAEVAQREVLQRQMVAQERLASLGALTAGIAHEIRNPLNFINNFAEVLVGLTQELEELLATQTTAMDEEATAEVEDLLSEIGSGAQRIESHGKKANDIVVNMLQHSRGVEAEFQPTDLNSLLEEYLRLAYHGARAQHPQWNAEYEVDLDPELPPVPVNAQGISRVLLNLIANAFDATREVDPSAQPEGYQPRVTVATRARDSRVEITVTDNGTGMDGELVEEAFHPFFTTKPVGQGTGLGLSISHDIVVDEHGGEMSLRSQPGAGTEVVVVLPMVHPAT